MPPRLENAPGARPDTRREGRPATTARDPFPGAVIAGAPKCGTSSLFSWLADHPGTVPSLRKETYFLMDRDSVLFPQAPVSFHADGLEAYARCFPEGPGLRFEATPDYMYQRTAPEVLASLRPVPDVLFVLRRPSRRVLSAYRFYRGPMAALDGSMTFAQYVDALLGREAPEITGHPLAALALEHSRYAVYLRRWREALPPGKVHVLLFEAMRDDPREFMARTCRLLGLDGAFYAEYDFQVRNRSFQVRSRLLQRAKDRVEPLLAQGPLRNALRGAYRKTNVVQARGDFEAALRAPLARLDEHFAPEARELASAFDLDLSPWRD